MSSKFKNQFYKYKTNYKSSLIPKLMLCSVGKSVTYLQTMKITEKQYQKALLVIKQYEVQQKPKDMFELLKKGFYAEVTKYIIERCDFEIDETFFTIDPACGLEIVIERVGLGANKPIAIEAIHFLKAIEIQGRLTYKDYLEFADTQ